VEKDFEEIQPSKPLCSAFRWIPGTFKSDAHTGRGCLPRVRAMDVVATLR
jgi:hypothetical protein